MNQRRPTLTGRRRFTNKLVFKLIQPFATSRTPLYDHAYLIAQVIFSLTYDVRSASLDDTRAIVGLFTAQIGAWQRIDARGHVEDVDYDALRVYDRWLHGGAWMSLETGAIHLNHLLSGGGLSFVALHQGVIVGYLEVYHGVEGAALGGVLHIAHLVTSDQVSGVDDALIAHLVGQAKNLKAQHITIARVPESLLTYAVERHFTLTSLACVRRYTVPARTGQVFYRAVEHDDADPVQINGWSLSIGRLTSARHIWEAHMPRLWETIPEIRARGAHRLKISASGQDALMVCERDLYNPRSADVYCWTPKALTAQLVASIKDWAHREGYRALSMVIADADVKALGADFETDGYARETCALDLA